MAGHCWLQGSCSGLCARLKFLFAAAATTATASWQKSVPPNSSQPTAISSSSSSTSTRTSTSTSPQAHKHTSTQAHKHTSTSSTSISSTSTSSSTTTQRPALQRNPWSSALFTKRGTLPHSIVQVWHTRPRTGCQTVLVQLRLA
eukprot:6369385-Amphidinium_carterae.1